MDIERVSEKNTDDIQKLSINVAEVVQIIKMSEERYNRDQQAQKERYERDQQERKEILGEMRKLSEAVGSTRGMEAAIAEIKGEVGKLRHEVGNVKNAQQILPSMSASITKNETKVEQIEKTIDASNIPAIAADVATLKKQRDETVGGARVAKAGLATIWQILLTIGGVISFIFAVYQYFDNKNSQAVIRAPANIEITESVEEPENGDQ